MFSILIIENDLKVQELLQLAYGFASYRQKDS